MRKWLLRLVTQYLSLSQVVPLPWTPVWGQDVWCGCWHVGSWMYPGRITAPGNKFPFKETFMRPTCGDSPYSSVCLLGYSYHSSLETQILTSWPRSLRLWGPPQKSPGLLVSPFLFLHSCLFFYFLLHTWESLRTLNIFCRELLVYQTTCPSKYFLALHWSIYSVQQVMTYWSSYRASSPLTLWWGPQQHRWTQLHPNNFYNIKIVSFIKNLYFSNSLTVFWFPPGTQDEIFQ